MRRRIFAALACALLLLGVLPVRAGPVSIRVEGGDGVSRERVYMVDEAGLLANWEADRLEEKARSIAQRYQCGVYMVMVDDYRDYGTSPRDAACNIFLDRNMGVGSEGDGVILLLSMDDRDFYTVSHGTKGRKIFTDRVVEAQESKFLDNFRHNDWYGGFSDFLDACEENLQGLTLKKLGVIFLQNAAVAAVVSVLICVALKAGMRSVRKSATARAYMDDAGSQLTVRTDQFTHATESRRTIQTSSSGGRSGGHSGGGGFSGGHGGKF